MCMVVKKIENENETLLSLKISAKKRGNGFDIYDSKIFTQLTTVHRIVIAFLIFWEYSR